ncbi:MAG: site-2 protease family protein [Proteobacteria bacterium]|nr:site-2 protease family protein [Pseudomonadota bacterium]
MDLSPQDIRWIIQGMIILILSIAVHEFGHAIVAHKLGDRLPESQGRVTLNPIAHADPIGTLLFPMLGLLFTGGKGFGFGWGKPVQVNPVAFSRRFTMRTGHMMVAIAGPLMNILFGIVIALILASLVTFEVLPKHHELARALHYAIGLNFILFFFNLIPAPPLDGGAVLEGLLPERMVPGFQRYAVYGPFVLMAVIFIPQLSQLFVKPAVWLHGAVWSVVSAIFGLS